MKNFIKIITKQRSLLFFLCLLFQTTILFSEDILKQKYDIRGNSTENFTSSNLELQIFSEKRRYSVSEDIILDLSITNNSEYPVTLYMHKNYLKNFTIIVKDMAGKSMPAKDISFFKDYGDYRDPFFHNYTATNFHSRAIVIHKGETIKRTLKIQDIVQLEKFDKKKIRYDITAYFYPNPEQMPSLFVKSENMLSVYVTTEKEYLLSNNTEKLPAFTMKKLAISPKEIVYLALSAEYEKDWPNYLKYISIRDVIKDYPNYARRYMQAQENEKQLIINDFQNYLITRETHKLVKFEIIKEIPENNISTVGVKAVRKVEGFEREFFYTYYLTKADRLWYITGIEAAVIK
ncbi:MAG: hypothetical protein OEZ22_08325 [Spirochaetia bacterium]|nr:hypothetical protein [Spirochaetia bacterium]